MFGVSRRASACEVLCTQQRTQHSIHRVWLEAVAWVRRPCQHPRTPASHSVSLQCSQMWTRGEPAAAAWIAWEHGHIHAVYGRTPRDERREQTPAEPRPLPEEPYLRYKDTRPY